VLVAWSQPVAAIEARSGENPSLAAGQTIDDDLAISGRAVTIAGRVSGDVYAAGNSVTILPGAQIDGNLFAAANAVTISGSIGGSVYTAGNLIQVQGTIGRNLVGGSNYLTLNPAATVKGNLLAGTNRLLLQGNVAGSVTGGVESLELAGTIGRDLRASVERLDLQPSARIGGNLTYISLREATVPAGIVQGSVERQTPPESARQAERRSGLGDFIFSLIMLAGVILLGLLLAWLFPGLLHAGQAIVERQALVAVGLGLVTLVALPIIAIFLLVTVIGIPLGLLGLAGWFFGWLLGWIIAATALAGLLVGLLRRSGRPIAIAWLVPLGLIGLHLLTQLPILGGIIALVVLCLGLGILVLLLSERWRRRRPAAGGLLTAEPPMTGL
jgi:cytoskeletal protein CcmA (bactofilin family)